MKRYLFLSLFIFLSQLLIGQDKEICKIYFIRHTEKVLDDSSDPLLTEVGEERAIHWANVFKNVDFDAVYSTNTLRTVATSLPTAAQNDLQIILYDATTIDISALAEMNKGKTILIVGHSNSTPELVNALLGEEHYSEIEDDNYSNLYIATYTENITDVTLLYIEL